MSTPPTGPGDRDPYAQGGDPYAQGGYSQPDAAPGQVGYAQPGGYPQQGGYPPVAQPQQMGMGRPGSGGGFFPFPHTSWRTSRGTQVTVGGCCLPLPLGCLTTVAAAGVVTAMKIAQSRR